MESNSTRIAKIAAQMAICDRHEEEHLKKYYNEKGIKVTAVNIGGNINSSITKILESALVAAKRNELIREEHLHEGAVIGAARDAIMQIAHKANGLNVGGKIGIARGGEHISVCIFLSIGLLHLDEVVIGLGHRVLPV